MQNEKSTIPKNRTHNINSYRNGKDWQKKALKDQVQLMIKDFKETGALSDRDTISQIASETLTDTTSSAVSESEE